MSTNEIVASQKPRRRSHGGFEECVVVGVGASAGGLDAYRRLLHAMPPDTGAAFVLIQHLDPSHDFMMADLLSKDTSMPVVHVDGPTPIRPNHVYVIPSKKLIRMDHGSFVLEDPVQERGMRMPIDYFFTSLAETRAERGVCIVLSGTGSDGTLGLKEVKAAGGMTIVQKPETAEHDGMPRSAVRSGMVDLVMAIEDIPEVLGKYVKHPYALGSAERRLYDASPEHFESILSLLKAHTDYDFHCYKKGSLNRRIQRRMGLRHVESLAHYLQLLREDHSEVRALFKDLLIGVTRFFRDAEAWQALEDEVLGSMVGSKEHSEPVRVWVPGCATGEEAYSVAIALLEQFERQKKNLDLQVFGTDLDDESIEIARAGSYPATIAADLSATRLTQFFLQDGEHYRVNKRLRETIVFAVQNLVSDPPFSNLDLIICRNLLIYLEQPIQRKLTELFHFALRDGGYLFLGTSESVTKGEGLFQPVSGTWRIYRKIGRARGANVSFPIVPTTPARGRRESVSESPSPSSVGVVEIARESLLDTFAPPSVLIDDHHLVHYVHGSLRHYLTVPSGEPTRDLLAMVDDRLRSKLRRLIRRAAKERESVTAVATRTTSEGEVSVRLSAVPVEVARDSRFLLVSFRNEPGIQTPAKGNKLGAELTRTVSTDSEEEQLVPQLEYELQATREDLQSTIEELETANEKLEASNEEVMSMNEELQSTNEELESSREELQSVNEELSTVNHQLEEKVSELETTNNDMTNLLTSTEIATIFLDTDFRVRRCTPSGAELFHVPDDAGRLISDLSPRVNDPDLLEDARLVLEKLSSLEKEVRSGDGRTFMRRILPYRTSDRKVDGVVVTFTDISSLQTAHRQLENRERQQAAVARIGRFALAATEIDPLLAMVPEVVAKTLDVPLAQVLRLEPGANVLRLVSGRGWEDGLVGEATVAAGIDSQAGYTLQMLGPVVVDDLATEKRFNPPPLLVEHGVVSGMSVIIGSSDAPWGVLGAHSRARREFTVDDVNFLQSVANVLFEAVRRRAFEQQVIERERRLDLITNAMPALIAYCDGDLVYRYCNEQYEEWFGLKQEEIVGKSLPEFIGAQAFDRVRPYIERVLKGESVSFDMLLPYRHGPPRDVHVNYVPHRTESGEVIGYYAMIEDISERVKANHMRARLAAIVEHSYDAIIGKDLNGIVTSWNSAAEEMYGYRAEEIVGKPIALLAPDDRADEIVEILDRAQRGEATEQLETVRRRKDGTLVDVMLTVSPIRGPWGEIVGASTIAHDITDRVRAERELQELADGLEERVAERTAVAQKRAEDLRELASQVAQAEQRARRRLARSIHDDLQQVLVATKMRIPVEGEIASAEELGLVSELLDEALDKSRALVTELSPPVLQDGSLSDALSWLARHMRDRHGLSVELHCEGQFDDMDRNTMTVLFEAVRELLFNVVKHAGTREASVVVDRDASGMSVQVVDSGKGFEPSVVLERAKGSEQFGLLSVRERIAAYGGAVEIDSAPGRGARFRLTVPLLKTHDLPKRRQPPKLREPVRIRRDTHGAVRILVVDDHQMVREGLVRILSSETGMEVVGEGADGEEAIDKALELEPDVVLMDITMPRKNGIEATREIVQRLPSTAVIGLSLHDERDLGAAIRKAGAVAFLRKDSASQRLIEVIRKHAAADTT